MKRKTVPSNWRDIVIGQYRPHKRQHMAPYYGSRSYPGARRVPSNYSRYTSQAAGYHFKRPFRRGYDRTSGYYGRFARTGGEMKFKDVGLDKTVTAGLVASHLTVLPQGNTKSERIGRKITIKKVHGMGAITLPPATAGTDTSDVVRMMLIQDTQTNGAAFTSADLLEADTFDSYRNLANSSRFRVLWTRTYALRSYGAGPSGAAIVWSEDVVKFKFSKSVNIAIEYDNSATTGALTTIRSNSIWMVYLSQEGLCSAEGTYRYRYTDD